MAAPTNDVSQHAPASEVSNWLGGVVDGVVRLASPELAKLVARFKSNAQDPGR